MQASTVLAFPAPALPPASPAIPPAILRRRESEVDVPELQQRLGLQAASTRTVIAHLRALFGSAGLPAPKNPRIVKGVEVTGAGAIHKGSLWHRVMIDDWFDDRTPPARRAALAAARRDQIRADLRRRARQVG